MLNNSNIHNCKKDVKMLNFLILKMSSEIQNSTLTEDQIEISQNESSLRKTFTSPRKKQKQPDLKEDIVTNSRLRSPRKRGKKKSSTPKRVDVETQTDPVELPELELAFEKSGTIPSESLKEFFKTTENSHTTRKRKQLTCVVS